MDRHAPFWLICGKRLLAVSAVLSFLSFTSCRPSDIASRFKSGANKQEGLNSSSLFLFERSPSAALSNQKILSTENLDRLVPKSKHVFSGILDSRSALMGSKLILQYSHFNLSAPTFYSWAGQDVYWKDNPDYRAFFAYYYSTKSIDYIDGLLGSLKTAGLILSNQVAWGENMMSGATFVAPNVFPLLLSVDNSKLPSGVNSFVTDTGYCPIFNSNFRVDGEGSCLSWSNVSALSPTDREAAFFGDNAYLFKKISFYRDSDRPSFNNVDDADVVAHEMFHVVQDAIVPDVLASTPGVNLQMDALFEGTADFFVGGPEQRHGYG